MYEMEETEGEIEIRKYGNRRMLTIRIKWKYLETPKRRNAKNNTENMNNYTRRKITVNNNTR